MRSQWSRVVSQSNITDVLIRKWPTKDTLRHTEKCHMMIMSCSVTESGMLKCPSMVLGFTVFPVCVFKAMSILALYISKLVF